MYSKSTVIINKSGLHARPASAFAQSAGRFTSELTVENAKTGRRANAKSIVMLLTLGLNQGAGIKISAEGPDERQAVDTLIGLVDSGLGE